VFNVLDKPATPAYSSSSLDSVLLSMPNLEDETMHMARSAARNFLSDLRRGRPSPGLGRLIRIAPLLTILGFLSGCAGGGPVPAPTAYTRFDSKDRQYMVEYPEGWQITAAGGNSLLSRSAFEMGSAKIAITADQAGSLMAGPARPPEPGEEPPVARMHEMSKDKLTDEIPGVEEQAAQPVKSVVGEGRVSEFSAVGSLGRKIKGYRATFLTRDRRLVVICQCSESDWENLKPAFMKVIQSIAPGRPA
jgi:hypothetical protein